MATLNARDMQLRIATLEQKLRILVCKQQTCLDNGYKNLSIEQDIEDVYDELEQVEIVFRNLQSYFPKLENKSTDKFFDKLLAELRTK